VVGVVNRLLFSRSAIRFPAVARGFSVPPSGSVAYPASYSMSAAGFSSRDKGRSAKCTTYLRTVQRPRMRGPTHVHLSHLHAFTFW